MRKCKQIIAILLVLIISVTGCADNSRNQQKSQSTRTEATKKNETKKDKNKKYNYDFSIYEDGRTFSDEQLSEQSEFETFLHEIFVEEMSQNTITTHFSIEHPENYGIEDFEATWGEISDLVGDEAATEINGILDALVEFDYDALTYEQQLMYDILKGYLETELAGSEYPLFDSAFSPISGLQGELPIIFSEYDFLSKDDIDDYITLLNASYNYIEQLCDYEVYRMEQGYTLTEESLDDVIAQCKEFVEEEPNCLRPVFEEKLNQFGSLTEEEKSQYMTAFDNGMSETLLPAYNLIIDTLTQIKEQEQSEHGLCNYENGSEYYEYLVRHNTGSARTVDELYQMMEEEIDRCSMGISTLFIANSNLYEDMMNYEYSTDDPEEMLEILISALEEDFPSAVNDEYTLNYVPESLESMMSPAFYLVPPIDNPKRNVIYINQSEEYAAMELFPTVAHEGFPGHMYQMNYFYSLEPHYFRSLLSFNGYSEGWAQYIETCYSYQYAGMSSSFAKASEYNASFSFALYCMVDIGVNYYGWDYEDTAEFLSQYIGENEEAVAEIYNTMIDEPTVYLRYYVGYLEILSLREEAEEILDSGFDIREFHRFLLEIGPCQYDVIENRMESWMDRVMAE